MGVEACRGRGWRPVPRNGWSRDAIASRPRTLHHVRVALVKVLLARARPLV